MSLVDLHVTLPAGPGRRRVIYEYLRDAVLEGYLRPGERLPASRELASRLEVSRATVLLDWARQAGAAVIEDDYDSEYRFGARPIDPLQTLDGHGRVIYVGSFSKTMLPTLRLGFLIAPPALRAALAAAKYVTDWHTALPIQNAMASFIDEGDFARHIRKMRSVYGHRHRLITTTISGAFGGHLEPVTSTVGIHIAAFAPRATAHDIDHLAEQASQRGVGIQRLASFTVTRPPIPGLVIGYGAIPTDRIPEGLHRLRHCFPP